MIRMSHSVALIDGALCAGDLSRERLSLAGYDMFRLLFCLLGLLLTSSCIVGLFHHLIILNISSASQAYSDIELCAC